MPILFRCGKQKKKKKWPVFSGNTHLVLCNASLLKKKAVNNGSLQELPLWHFRRLWFLRDTFTWWRFPKLRNPHIEMTGVWHHLNWPRRSAENPPRPVHPGARALCRGRRWTGHRSLLLAGGTAGASWAAGTDMHRGRQRSGVSFWRSELDAARTTPERGSWKRMWEAAGRRVSPNVPSP